MEVITTSTEETKRLAEKLAITLKPNDVVLFYGDLGSGKTTFTGFLAKSLGFDNRVQSPTFVIIRNYKKTADDSSEISQIHHVDLYRLTSVEEVSELGLLELIDEPKTLTIIEWPEIAEEILPNTCKKVYFEYVDENSRKITINE